MANLRVGQYSGVYYGSFFNESEPLTSTEMHQNARYIYEILHFVHGWTMNAVCGMLGNMQAESSINPGRWQSDKVGSYSLGYGLVQWTPVTKYTNWCASNGWSDPSEMDAGIARILWEVENREQWYATDSYDFSFKEFTQSTQSAGYLAKSFILNYERPKDQSSSVQNYRASLGEYWYSFISSIDYTDPDVPVVPDIPDNPNFPDAPIIRKKHKSGYKFVLYANKNRRILK